MPTYEYECSACGHTFERFQSITAKPVRMCPSCAKPSVTRLIGAGAGVLFRGSGFYQTDYRSESYKQKAKAEKEASGTLAKPDGAKASSGGKSGKESSSSDGKKA